MRMKELALIVAIGPEEVIGYKDKLLWHSKQDFYHFKKTTFGYPCIFGKTTFMGLPKKPLRNRLNIVVDGDIRPGYKFTELNLAEEVFPDSKGSFIVSNNIEDAVKVGENFDKVFICGGASIYKYVLTNDYVNTIYLTKIISPSIEKKVEENSKDFVYFPISLQEKLMKGWKRVPFEYEENELPEEDSDIIVQFQKWIKE